jgi:hypothetical protein
MSLTSRKIGNRSGPATLRATKAAVRCKFTYVGFVENLVLKRLISERRCLQLAC